MHIWCPLIASKSSLSAVQSKQLQPRNETQDEDGDDDGDGDDNDDDADGDDDTNVPRSDDYENGDTEAAVVGADTSDCSVHRIISCKGEAISCLCLSRVGRCMYQREPLCFPHVLSAS